jgi:hypothetical protein
VNFFIKSISIALAIGIILHIFFSEFILAWNDIGAATGFALFFTVSGYFSYLYAMRLKHIAFFTIICSTMLIRMTIMLFLIVFWIRYQSTDTKVFLVSLVLWYALLVLPEVMSFNRMRVKERY